jgi:hypothetical protein
MAIAQIEETNGWHRCQRAAGVAAREKLVPKYLSRRGQGRGETQEPSTPPGNRPHTTQKEALLPVDPASVRST